jgi:hypothetical protein
MKQGISIVIVGIFICTAFGAVAQPGDGSNQGDNFATHTVLGEYGTATWCGYCKYAHGALKELYKRGWHDFFYVSLVCDVNTHANARRSELGITGYPTVCWDGKYRTNVGAGSIPSAMAAYNTSIIACAARTVPNIDLSVSATWLGSATMNITVTVTNNQATTYSGYLRCYVTEIASSLGWTDTAGYPYTFAFLQYAFNQAISVPASGVWSNSMIWNGALYNNGMGQTYAGLVKDNAFIVAAVFASSGGYVDETAGFRVGNNRVPNAPSSPGPANGATNVKINPTLSWQCSDPDWFDTLYYDVYFEKNNPTPSVLVSNNQTATTYTPGNLDLGSTYYWKIVVRDDKGATVTGPVWQFTTRGNNPPNTPSNPNPANGSTDVPTNKVLSWTGGDPDGDTVRYDVYFGVTTPPGKVVSNQTGTTYNPGTLNTETTYYWRIVSWDSFAASTAGPVWVFTTSTAPNNPPNTPVLSGPTQGSKGVTYTYNVTGTDPDSNQISFYVDWGDDTNSGWLGPYASGHMVSVDHQWSEKGTYVIKAKVKDEHGAESGWAQMTVIMPAKFGLTMSFLTWLWVQFPDSFPLLRLLLGS